MTALSRCPTRHTRSRRTFSVRSPLWIATPRGDHHEGHDHDVRRGGADRHPGLGGRALTCAGDHGQVVPRERHDAPRHHQLHMRVAGRPRRRSPRLGEPGHDPDPCGGTGVAANGWHWTTPIRLDVSPSGGYDCFRKGSFPIVTTFSEEVDR
jgi:hypothetical protein